MLTCDVNHPTTYPGSHHPSLSMVMTCRRLILSNTFFSESEIAPVWIESLYGTYAAVVFVWAEQIPVPHSQPQASICMHMNFVALSILLQIHMQTRSHSPKLRTTRRKTLESCWERINYPGQSIGRVIPEPSIWWLPSALNWRVEGTGILGM